MPDDPSAPRPTPTNYQRTTGGSHLRWQPPTPEHLQEMLPAYEILNILGQGGMGAVYKGRQKSLDRIVAIKILPPEAGEDDMQFVERFKNEARTMAKMNHPAIVHVYDFGETTEGQLFIVMEFIDGTDVAKMIQEKKKLPEDYALAITAHVCDALGYAHTQGVVHRDIKPANILINMEGQVKVADFGLAKATDPSQMGLTKTNMAMGTPDFVSPEALMPGVPLDGRADLYAVGVMLFNMLTGTIPRGAFRMPSITHQTDARFDKIIGKAMEMDRELRYQTALELRRDLDVILTTPAAKTGMQTIPAQLAAAPQSMPQKPMGKSPSAPQQQKPAASAGMPAGSAKTPQGRAKPASGKVAPATASKSNAGMIYGIAAVIMVVAVAVFMFAGGGEKAVTAAKPTEPAKPQPPPPEPSKTTPKPAPKPVATVSTAPAPAVKDGVKWVDGLAEWFGGAKTHDAFVRKPGEDVRVGKVASMRPLPDSAPLMRDMAVRARVRLGDAQEASEVALSVRSTMDASKEASSYNIKFEAQNQRVRLGYNRAGTYQGFIDYKLPADFDFTTPHTLELRVVGDLLTVTLDGRKLGERRDSLLAAGHPVLRGSKAWIESLEYADLGTSASAPAVVTSAQPGDVLTFAGHRYQIITEKLQWDAAKAKAVAMGGHLATITSLEEYNWVWGQMVSKLKKTANDSDTERCFIGALNPRFKLSAPEAGWEWVTGESFTTQPWMGTFSNDQSSGDKVLAWVPGKRWDDVTRSSTGSKTYFSLVEWDDDDRSGSTPPRPSMEPLAAKPPLSPAVEMPVVAPTSAPPSDPRLAQLEAGYQARYDTDAQKPFLAAVTTLNQSYVVNGISRARAAAQAKGSLAEVTALDAEKAAIEKGSGVPVEDAADTPESLKALRGTYRGALAKITAERDTKAAPLLDLYLKALDVYVAELTKAGKIDEAKQVQTLRDAKATQKPGEETKAAPASTVGAAAPAMVAKTAKKLFNGANTEGWRYQGPQEAFVVEDGCIKVAGPRGNLMFMGNQEVSPIMKDFDLTMKVKTEDKANSGVFIHCKRNNDGASYANGLEAQIANENKDPQKTGSLWSVQPVEKIIVHDGEWFDYRINVRGMTVTTFINGKQVNEWTQPADWKSPPGKPEAKLGEGTIGLQSNGGTVWIKDVEITLP